ncbi:hypothetical protein BGW38_008889 [Lunasporangiospora selenospora]|uniref:Uncharacterized protein n=1 Tax=Lunasporangiospora selenospora TaxID=979761 RepID=A0A9P6KG60_9FUNG|nr:hypothetical protein BGW38_008889 [Lunasporangiospora selenospora]
MSLSTLPLRVQLNGILLSTILFECANARVDYLREPPPLHVFDPQEGLILGHIVTRTRAAVDDNSDARIETTHTTIVVQGVYKLEPNLPKFYGPSGDIIESTLEKYSIPPNLSILGYLKYRRTDWHQLSIRDRAIASNLRSYLERKRGQPRINPFSPRTQLSEEDTLHVSVALITAKANENESVHDYDYTFWSVPDNTSPFTAIPVNISNMVESPQEDYQSFQSNLAIGATWHPASVNMMNTIKATPSLMLVDGHEAMYKETFESTNDLVHRVIASEQEVQEVLHEVDQLRRQVERSKIESKAIAATFNPKKSNPFATQPSPTDSTLSGVSSIEPQGSNQSNRTHFRRPNNSVAGSATSPFSPNSSSQNLLQ